MNFQIADEEEEIETPEDEEASLADDLLEEVGDVAEVVGEEEIEGFGHIAEVEEEEEEEDKEEEEEGDEELEEDAEDVDFDTFDDVDEM
ncbi:hypothetical protein GW937_01820 [Candidatus Kaiserbacteria bacterium]|nr:hypothetical protein [Candidatus Kaiserbacteria bacterium]